MSETVFWGIIVAALGLVLAARIFKRGDYVPLSRRQPATRPQKTPELGLEAVDHAALARTHRQNAALDRGVSWVGSDFSQADLSIPPEADDADYARRYHRAHNRKTSRSVK